MSALSQHDRDFLRAIVAIWLTNGQQPLDGTNAPRALVADHDYPSAFELTCALLDAGMLRSDMADDPAWFVAPTALGVFTALS